MWRPISNSDEFGAWFQAKFEGPFAPGVTARVRVAIPGYEHLKIENIAKHVETSGWYQPSRRRRCSPRSCVTRQAVTKHLNVLEGAGLVRGIRRGRERIWELEPRELETPHRHLEQIARRWDAALGRLKNLVKEG